MWSLCHRVNASLLHCLTPSLCPCVNALLCHVYVSLCGSCGEQTVQPRAAAPEDGGRAVRRVEIYDTTLRDGSQVR